MALLRVCTFNMHGVNNGIDIVNQLSNRLDVICLQETWLRSGDYVPFVHLSDFDKFTYSAMQEGVHMVGRPFGGLTILTRTSCVHSVVDVGCSFNNRAQCISFEYSGRNYVLFNMYLPCAGAVDYDADVQIIHAFMMDIVHNIVASGTQVLIAGDFNVDMKIENNVNSVNSVKAFIQDCNLISCLSHYGGDLWYTFRCAARNVYTSIDNIFVPASAVCSVGQVEIIDDSINFSDHLPVICALHYNVACDVGHVDGVHSQQDNHYCVYVWSDLAKQQYYYSTGVALQALIASLPWHESRLSGHEYVEVLYTHLVDVLIKCSAVHCKTFVSKSHNTVPWSHRLEYLKCASRDALNSWRAGGCPLNGSLKEKLALARRDYKKAVKTAKRDYKAVRADRLRHSLSDQNSRKFWRLVNNDCNRQTAGMVSSLDANSFATSFRSNFVNSADNMAAVKNHLSACGEYVNKTELIFDVEEVEKAALALNNSSALDSDGINAFHLKYAHPAICVILKTLYNKMMQLGAVPRNFGRSVITPVVKNASRSTNDLSNYRPVSIISIIAKTFESLVNLRFGHLFSTSVNQFGFSANGGCSKAIFAFNSTVQYFREKNSNVYLCALDISKAFDRLNHYSIFQCLIERGLPVQLVDVFCGWFRNMLSCVKWGSSESVYFNVLSGCPQGSILGPKFFNMVMDKLLVSLEKSGLGCYVGNSFAGAVAYADDVILLSASVRKLKLMLSICYDFGVSCDLSFNTDKSFCGLVGRLFGGTFPTFLMGGQGIPRTENLVYLGVTFKLGSVLNVDFSDRCRKFMASVCSVLRHKVTGYEDVFSEILIRKCLPVLDYGLDCVFLDSSSFNVISKAWNTAFRWLFNRKKFESTRLLFLQCDTMSAKYLLDLKLMCFVRRLVCSSNLLLRNLCCFAFCGTTRPNSLSAIFRRYNLIMFNRIDTIRAAVFDSFLSYCMEAKCT